MYIKEFQAGTISASESFCSHFCRWQFLFNYVTDLCIYGNYASDNACCILAGFQVLLSVTGMLVDLSVTIMQVTVSVVAIQLEISAAHTQVRILGVSVAIMHVVFCAGHYAHDCVY